MNAVRHTGAINPWAGKMSGRDVATLTLALLLTVAVLNVLLAERLGLLFDLAFVCLCLYAAIAVRRADAYWVSLLPPVAMALVMALVAMTHRTSIARAGDSYLQAFISGLSTHALALGVGYALCLAILAIRRELARPAR